MIAMTTVAVLRGETDTEDGDAVDEPNAVVTGVPASIQPMQIKTNNESSNRPTNIRKYIVRVPNGTDVEETDRLLNERTGTIYLIDTVHEQAPVAGLTDLRLDVSRVS